MNQKAFEKTIQSLLGRVEKHGYTREQAYEDSLVVFIDVVARLKPQGSAEAIEELWKMTYICCLTNALYKSID